MSDAFEVIKKLVKVVEGVSQRPAKKKYFDNNTEAYLEEKGLSREAILSASAEVGKSLKVTHENAKEIEIFADLIRANLQEYVISINLYLEILKVAAYKSSVYSTLVNVYFYDFDTINDFDFIGNADKQFATPYPGVDPLFYAMSYTYMGVLFQRLGRFGDARKVFNLSMAWKGDPRNVTKNAEYGNLELDYLAEVTDANYLADDKDKLAKDDKPTLVVGSIFFGSKYEEMFHNVAGKTFFCEENLKELRKKWNPVVVVFCTLFERMHLENSDLYAELSEVMPFKIVIIPEHLIWSYPEPTPPGKDFHPALPYTLSGLLQTCIFVIAKQINASVINLPPDAIFSDVAVSEITSSVGKGNKIVFTPGIRLNRENVLDEVSEIRKEKDEGKLALSVNELTDVALRNMHRATEAAFGTNEKITHPGMVWWPSEEGLFGHCFQMHPIFVSSDLVAENSIRRFDSIDGDFVYAMMPNEKEWEDCIDVITEPERTMMFELSGPDVPVSKDYKTADLANSSKAAFWITSVMRPLSFWLFKKRIIFGKVPEDKNKELYEKADPIVKSLGGLGKGLNFVAPVYSAENVKAAGKSLDKLVDLWTEEGSSKKKHDTVVVESRIGKKPAEEFRVIYSLAVWGRRYIENFLNICLPSMLADGNLGNMPNNENSLFLLYTRTADVPLFESDSQFQRLKEIIPVEIVPLDPEFYDNKYYVLSGTQSNTVQRSREFDAVCFLYSDFLWATGGIRFCLEKLSEGYEGVVSPVPPLILEQFYDTLNHNLDDFVRPREGDGAFDISVDPRKLIKYAKPILHPMMRDNIVDNQVNTANPAYLLWNGPKDDLLIRCFHSHPVLLKVKHHSGEFWKPFKQTLDEWFLPNAFASTDQLYFVKDSDELAIISLTEEDFPTPYLGEHHHLDASFIAQWAEACAAPMHKIMFNYYTLWHEHEIDDKAWEPTIERSTITAQEVQIRLSTPDSSYSSENPIAYKTRKDRAQRVAYMRKSDGTFSKVAWKRLKHRAYLKILSICFKAGSIISRENQKKIVYSLPGWLRNWIIAKHRINIGLPVAPDHGFTSIISRAFSSITNYLKSLITVTKS